MGKKDDDRRAAEQRAQDTRDRIAKGQGIDRILADRQAARSRTLLERAVRQDKRDKK